MNLRQSSTLAIAGLGSVGLHVGALIGLIWLTTPEPFEDQKLRRSQILIQPQEVKRVDAREETAPAEQLNETLADAPSAVQGTVPQSKAVAVGAQSEPSSAKDLNSAQLGAARPKTPTTLAAPASAEIIALAAPQPQDIQATTGPQETVAALSAPVQATAKPVPVSSQTAAPVILSAGPPTASIIPASVPLAPASPAQTPATALPAQAQSATAVFPASAQITVNAILPATKPVEVAPTTTSVVLTVAANQSNEANVLPLLAVTSKAALAWSGNSEEQVESASLTAIQAFMRPGDLNTSNSDIGDVRDGISAILASVPCSRLQTTFIPETGQLELRGHLPEDALRGPVFAALQERLGDAIPVSDQLLILPRPQCGALSGIAAVGLPQSTDQLTSPRVIGEDGFARSYTYFNGQRLELELEAPDYDGFVYVDYFTADGNVIHLQPNTIVPLEFAPAKSALTIGKDRGGKPALDITISPPFGQEIAAAFASSVPLYEGLRPLQEPAEPYLEYLKRQVTAARAENPDFKGEWVYFFISTKPD